MGSRPLYPRRTGVSQLPHGPRDRHGTRDMGKEPLPNLVTREGRDERLGHAEGKQGDSRRRVGTIQPPLFLSPFPAHHN